MLSWGWDGCPHPSAHPCPGEDTFGPKSGSKRFLGSQPPLSGGIGRQPNPILGEDEKTPHSVARNTKNSLFDTKKGDVALLWFKRFSLEDRQLGVLADGEALGDAASGLCEGAG